MALSALIALTVLLGWFSSNVQTFLPDGWDLMKANTAACTLLSLCAMAISYYQTNPARILAGQVIVGIVLLIAGTALLGHATREPFYLETLLASDHQSLAPGRMSIQTSLFFVMLGFACICEGKDDPTCSLIRDLVCSLLVTLVFVVAAGYLFGASTLFGQGSDIRTSPQTLVSMVLLATSLLITRMQQGYFAILAGIGIGSEISRAVLPLAVSLPFLIISCSVWLSQGKGMSPALASALTASLSAGSLFVVLVWLSRKINGMEAELRDISLVDDLTKINNRRGFFMLGEHMLFEAHRDGRTITVLFLDLDGLKAINDTLGHDIGSDLLKHVATLLRDHFRKSDVVARLGGDEFAVVSSSGDTQIALKRLERVVNAINKAGKRPYHISYSAGEATFSADNSLTSFSELVATADARMYERKRAKKQPRQSSLRSATSSPAGEVETAS